MTENPIKTMLLSLGLSEHESTIYLEIARLGIVTSGPLIKNTGLHRNVVYTAIEHLVAQKYVTESQIRGKMQFSITDPVMIRDAFQEKLETAKEVALRIAQISQRQPQEISVHEGNEEYLRLLTNLIRQLPKGGVKYVLGTGGAEFMNLTMKPIWKHYHKVAQEQGITIRMIAYVSQRQALAVATEEEGIYEVRYLPDNIENPSGVHIYPEADTILNIVYSSAKHPVTAIRIRNEDLAHGQLTLFKNLWEIAKA